ncbi:MAG: restriction endonuclease subunit S [Shewanella sp.]|uniref:restriction endonuclease subunit S n=1 Tax=Shewanella sp. TaxID=50422 RepID=UPI003F38A0A1
MSVNHKNLSAGQQDSTKENRCNRNGAAELNAVPVGYKQTEVGVIPEDWEVVCLGEIGQSLIGLTYSPKDVSDGGVLVLRSSNVQNGRLAYEDCVFVQMELPDRVIVKEGDILICVRNGSRQLIGKCALIDKYAQGFAFGAFMSVYRTEASGFAFYQFQSDVIQSQINETMGATINQITNRDLSGFKIMIPNSILEQTAIANVLSDSDALIGALEQLIAKKQAIKSATMQQLLTGRTRLPQFALREDGTPKGTKPSELGEIPEDWEDLGFGALFQPSISKKPIKPMSLVSFVGMQDVTEQAQLSTQHVLAIENVKSGFTYFERGDVLVAKITPCFENGKGCHTETLSTDIGFGSTEFHVLRATDNSDSRFIYYWSNRNVFRKSLESEMVGSAGHRRVPLSAIAKYTIPVPPKEEQTAIATILSDMDAEIQALEQRLGKTRQIKQGMMQELLTGKTRLVQPLNKESQHG